MNQQHNQQFQRINVVGSSGSGKSIFSRKLSAILSIPHVEMDAIFWQPNWQESDDNTFFSKLSAEISPLSNQVLDGNYTRSIPIKWEKVDLVIWLDYSFIRTVFQAIRRAISRAWSQKELWAGTGNKETFRKLFSKDSIVLYTIKSHKRIRKKYELILLDESYSHIEFIHLRSRKESEEFLQQIKDWSNEDQLLA